MNLVSDHPKASAFSGQARRVARGLLIAVGMAGGFVMACGGDGSGGGGVAGLVAALDAGFDLQCNCAQFTAEQCSSVKTPVRACVEDAAEEAGGVPSCAETLIRNYSSCLQRQGQCTNEGLGNAECDTAFMTARSNCPLDPAVINCFDGEPPDSAQPGNDLPDTDPPDNEPGNDPPGNDPPGNDPPPTLLGCNETCFFTNDDECDDGGPGSFTNACDLGTDCADCGPR